MKWSFSMHLTAQILNRSPAFNWDGSLSVSASSICSSTFRMPRLRRSAASAMTRHLARGRSNAQFKEKSKTPYPKQSCRGVEDRKTGYAWITGKGNGRLATEKCFSHCVAQKPLSITASGRGTRRAPKTLSAVRDFHSRHHHARRSMARSASFKDRRQGSVHQGT